MKKIALLCALGLACASSIAAPAQAQPAQAQPAQAPADELHGGSPHADNPHSGKAAPKPISEERPDPSVPPGSIRVRVIDQADAPVANAEIALGIMSSNGDRETKPGRTAADGSFTFSGLPTGDQKAFRINIPFDGAKYSSSPFRLPAASGYEVTIRRLPVTRDERMVVLYVGATSVELKDDRLKIIQQSRLLNLGGQTYVFPKGGAKVVLPAGFTGVQTEESMGDQQVKEGEGGLTIEGSVLPGETTLLWGFDLPITGSDASFEVGLPWITFAYRVIADAPEGLQLRVDEMPEPFLQRDAGRRFWITEMQRRVGDPPFRKLVVHVTGIPGPGPSRFIAVALALGMVLAGVAVARRNTRGSGQALAARNAANGAISLTAIEARQRARAAQLEEERATGAIGPEHHREQLDAVIDELAVALLERSPAPEESELSARAKRSGSF